jgi:hypothetical protein
MPNLEINPNNPLKPFVKHTQFREISTIDEYNKQKTSLTYTGQTVNQITPVPLRGLILTPMTKTHFGSPSYQTLLLSTALIFLNNLLIDKMGSGRRISNQGRVSENKMDMLSDDMDVTDAESHDESNDMDRGQKRKMW